MALASGLATLARISRPTATTLTRVAARKQHVPRIVGTSHRFLSGRGDDEHDEIEEQDLLQGRVRREEEDINELMEADFKEFTNPEDFLKNLDTDWFEEERQFKVDPVNTGFDGPNEFPVHLIGDFYREMQDRQEHSKDPANTKVMTEPPSTESAEAYLADFKKKKRRFFYLEEDEQRDRFPEGLAGTVEPYWELSRDRAWMARDSTLQAMKDINAWAEAGATGLADTPEAILLTGRKKAGKSVAFNQSVHFARSTGWLVLCIPDAFKWVHRPSFFPKLKNGNGLFGQSPHAKKLLEDFRHAHAKQLGTVVKRTGTGKGSLTLLEFIDEGLSADYPVEESDYSDMLWELREELPLITEFPVLVAVDQYNMWFQHPVEFPNGEGEYMMADQLAVVSAFATVDPLNFQKVTPRTEGETPLVGGNSRVRFLYGFSLKHVSARNGMPLWWNRRVESVGEIADGKLKIIEVPDLKEKDFRSIAVYMRYCGIISKQDCNEERIATMRMLSGSDFGNFVEQFAKPIY